MTKDRSTAESAGRRVCHLMDDKFSEGPGALALFRRGRAGARRARAVAKRNGERGAILPCWAVPMPDHILRPVAILRTPFAEKFGVPRQSGLVPEAEGRVEFGPEFSALEFTRGLEAFSHVWLITGFHDNP